MKEYNIKDYRTERWNGFKDYYVKMMYCGDCDPSYPALNYISDRFELNLEQRYWLSFLYGTNYCVPTTFYIINEFPDYEFVDIERLQKWWKNNKEKTYFQTDRRRVRNYDGVFIKCFESYKQLVGESQIETFNEFKKIKDLEERYKKLYKFTNKIYYFGRFSLFNYLETINELTDLNMKPNTINFKHAESSRNGMCYACKKDDFVTIKHKKSKMEIDYGYLNKMLSIMKHELQIENKEIDVNYWNIETCLCAYKKLFWNTRYLGYYIDRQQEEIQTLEKNVREGVDWDVLWDFRSEFFEDEFLGEHNGWNGTRKNCMNKLTKHGKISDSFPNYDKYKRKVEFNSIGDVYDQTKSQIFLVNEPKKPKVKKFKVQKISDVIG